MDGKTLKDYIYNIFLFIYKFILNKKYKQINEYNIDFKILYKI